MKFKIKNICLTLSVLLFLLTFFPVIVSGDRGTSIWDLITLWMKVIDSDRDIMLALLYLAVLIPVIVAFLWIGKPKKSKAILSCVFSVFDFIFWIVSFVIVSFSSDYFFFFLEKTTFWPILDIIFSLALTVLSIMAIRGKEYIGKGHEDIDSEDDTDVKSVYSAVGRDFPYVEKETQSSLQPFDGRECTNCGNRLRADDVFCDQCGMEYKSGKRCANCGKELTDDDDFCPSCGSKYVEPVKEEEEEIFCAHCGAKLKAKMAFCNKCGNRVEEED